MLVLLLLDAPGGFFSGFLSERQHLLPFRRGLRLAGLPDLPHAPLVLVNGTEMQKDPAERKRSVGKGARGPVGQASALAVPCPDASCFRGVVVHGDALDMRVVPHTEQQRVLVQGIHCLHHALQSLPGGGKMRQLVKLFQLVVEALPVELIAETEKLCEADSFSVRQGDGGLAA